MLSRPRGEGTIVTYNYRDGAKVPVPDEIRRRIETLEQSGK
jgi:hypothetical protein